MGNCCSKTDLGPEPKTPWEKETYEVRKLANGETDPHTVSLLCQRNKLMFVDLTFPPCNASAGKGHEDKKWGRPTEMFKSQPAKVPVLYDSDISVDDVQQGGLGDCWLICTFALLAQFPSAVRRICPVQYSSMEQGVFRLRLCRDGWWEWIVIDSYFPCSDPSRPSIAFGSCRNECEFWVAVLEKAYARIYGNYEAIVGGLPAVALNDLTGCPSRPIYDLDKVPEADLLKQLDAAIARKCLVTTYTKGKDTSSYVKTPHSAAETSYADYCKKLGIVPGHAYGVLRVASYKGTNLIQLRNPWGSGEWTGAWSDGSKEWTEDAKSHIAYVNADDGSFWMPLTEFMKLFGGVAICEFKLGGAAEDWTDHRIRGTVVHQRPNFFAKILCKHDTKVEVHVYNQSGRRDSEEEKQKRTYVNARVYQMGKDGKTYSVIDQKGDTMQDRETYTLPASPHPYLVIPFQQKLTAKNNDQFFTVVINCQERQTEVRTHELTAALDEKSIDGREITVTAVAGCQASSIPTQRNGLLPPTVNWTSDLVRCPGEGECGQCAASVLVPCIVNAQLRSKYDGSNCCLNLFCVTSPLTRNIVREGYSIEGNCVGDLCKGSCCYPCSLMQIRRELDSATRFAQVASKGVAEHDFVTSCYTVDHCCSKPCLISCLLPCVSNAYTRHAYDGSNVCLNCMCLFGPISRNIVREGYNLKGGCVSDIICATCFAPCSANQLRQEVEIRGPKALQDVEQVASATLPPPAKKIV